MVAIPNHVASLAGPSPHSARPDRGGGLEGAMRRAYSATLVPLGESHFSQSHIGVLAIFRSGFALLQRSLREKRTGRGKDREKEGERGGGDEEEGEGEGGGGREGGRKI